MLITEWDKTTHTPCAAAQPARAYGQLTPVGGPTQAPILEIIFTAIWYHFHVFISGPFFIWSSMCYTYSKLTNQAIVVCIP
jgi:hypothetical protein